MLECKDTHHPLTESEKHVISFMNNNIDDIASMSITEISARAFVSTATISRAIRKCGYSSFLSARYHLAQSNTKSEDLVSVNQVLSKSYTECVKTIESIDINDILNIAHLIHSAKRTVVLARGMSRYVAEDFAFQLQCLGINCFAMTDAKIMEFFDRFTMPDDLVIIFSVKASTKELAYASKIAHDQQLKVISCVCAEGTALEEFSDIVVHGYSMDITPNALTGSRSRIPLLLISRTIVEYLGIVKSDQRTKNSKEVKND